VQVRLSCGFGVAAVAAVVAATAVASAGSVRARELTRTSSVSQATCSKTAATQLVKQHNLNSFLLQDPVRQVLCGPFTGPNSQAMAIAIAAATCWGIQQWAVFRFAGGAWQLVLDRYEFVFLPLVRVRGDIRITSPVFRPGDPRCVPSGGKHARVWHWNGRRFVAGPWKQVTPPKSGPKTVHLYNIRSPSHNLYCDVGDEDNAYCVSKNLPHSVTLTRNGTLRICNGPRCVGNNKLFGSGIPVLPYGQQDVQGAYRCKSARNGITCTEIPVGKGYRKGFLINASGVTKVG
jgi:hypothetical protein